MTIQFNDMDSVLNELVSCAKNYSTIDNLMEVNLLVWLNSAKHAAKVDRYRRSNDPAEQARIKEYELPAITPSGLFSIRQESGLIKHSGLIPFDLDLKHNRHVANWDQLRYELPKSPNIAYLGASISGKGYWGLIPIAYPDKHKQHFEFIYKFFESKGLFIDRKPSNVSSLRGYSYDPSAYFNHQAKPLEKYNEENKIKTFKSFEPSTERDKNTVLKIIESANNSCTDITNSYADWYTIGCCLATTFGPEGEDYFHSLSIHYHDYNISEASRQFAACLKATSGKPADIGALVNIAKRYGLIVGRRQDLMPQPKDNYNASQENTSHEISMVFLDNEAEEQNCPFLSIQQSEENKCINEHWATLNRELNNNFQADIVNTNPYDQCSVYFRKINVSIIKS